MVEPGEQSICARVFIFSYNHRERKEKFILLHSNPPWPLWFYNLPLTERLQISVIGRSNVSRDTKSCVPTIFFYKRRAKNYIIGSTEE